MDNNVKETLEMKFALALKEAGLDLGDELPVMDGKVHRVPLQENSQLNGAYLGYPRGVGFINIGGDILDWQPESENITEIPPF